MKEHALVVATNNHGKLAEIRALLADLPVDVQALTDVRKKELVVVEDGVTFRENAVKKARAVAEATMMLSLGDDSGLEVDALGGEPGVRSARYAHGHATDAENNAALLSALDALTDPPGSAAKTYTARFRCVLALVDPFVNDGEPWIVEGTCEGTIARAPRGSGGFGYDPLFVVDGAGKTMAELGEAEKNSLSHRARACAALRPVLERALCARREATRKITEP